jgi:hypothetical protein
MNGEGTRATFRLPEVALGRAWKVVVDTRDLPRMGEVLRTPGSVEMDAGSFVAMIDVSRESP